MSGFIKFTGLVVPLDISNIDTDAIIPKQFLKKVTRTGFGKHLFHAWRFLDEEGKQPNPSFPLNFTKYQGASILLTRKNFGCGSSREHAPWALKDYGIKAIIAPSFADIFYNNCLNNHMLPVALSEEEVDELFTWLANNSNTEIEIDLKQQQVKAGKNTYYFEIDSFRKYSLLNGLDNIDLTLQHEEQINTYETNIPDFLS